MADYGSPGVFIEGGSLAQDTIHGVGTSTVGMLGLTEKGPSEVRLVNSFREYCRVYGGYLSDSYLPYAVEGFFLNGGRRCFIGRIEASSDNKLLAKDFTGDRSAIGKPSGLAAFRGIDEINIVYVPDVHTLSETEATILTVAIKDHCEQMKYRFAIFDIGKSQRQASLIEKPVDSSYAAVYYPWLKVTDPLSSLPILIPPGGHVAGIYVRSDINRGVHKPPANEVINGVLEPEYLLSNLEGDVLNQKGINTIRKFPGRGTLVWGARTCTSNPEWKYINVRRLFLYIEESIVEGTQWVVFEPNNEKLWARVTQAISKFLTTMWRTGALMGLKAEEAFFVRCDRTTMTQDDIVNGWLVCEVGVAPIRPAEFLIVTIRQRTA